MDLRMKLLGTPQRYPSSFLPGVPVVAGDNGWMDPSAAGARSWTNTRQRGRGLLGVDLDYGAATAAAREALGLRGILPAIAALVMSSQ
jgi:hypothetical protein